ARQPQARPRRAAGAGEPRERGHRRGQPAAAGQSGRGGARQPVETAARGRAPGVELALRAVFASPPIAGLAERIATARRQAAAPARYAGAAPLSFAQERLWFPGPLEPGTPAYHIPVAV